MSEKELKLTDLDYATGDHHLQMMKAALPYLEITGNGAEGKVVVNGVEFAVMPPADRVLYADCENWDAYLTGGTNANALVGGTWPTLQPGENTISWSGGVTSVTLTPRWWTL